MRRPFGTAAAILVALLSLCALGLMLPWLECPSCDGRGLWGTDGPRATHAWACALCRDRARVSPLRRLRGDPTHPLLRTVTAWLNGSGGGDLVSVGLQPLFALGGLDGAREFRPAGIGFPRICHAYVESDAGLRLLLVFCGSRGQFGPRHPKPWHALVYLFDEEARLLDRWEIDEADENQCADFDFLDEEGAVGVVMMFPRAGQALPADLELVLRRDGKEEKLPGTSVRVGLRKGRLAVEAAP